MKKALIISTGIVLAGIVFEGCKKGDGDPFLSLHSRKARVAGEWKLSTGKTTDKSVSGTMTTTTTTEYTGSAANESTTIVMGSFSNTTTNSKGYTESWKFEKDGKVSGTIVDDGSTTTVTGVWNFTNGVGDLKNKEQLVMTFLTTTSGSSTSTSTGVTNDVTYDIYELKNKEMILKQTNTSSSSSGSDDFSSEMTFTQ